MTTHSNLKKDGAVSSIHHYSAKQQAEMLGSMHKCAVPGCKTENKFQHGKWKIMVEFP